MEIQDFGEKIGGAKKDLWKERGLSVEDLLDMNDAEKRKIITKDNIWKKPNYQEMVENGLPVRVVYFIKSIRDATPPQPTFLRYDLNQEKIEERLEDYINFVSDLRDMSMNLSTENEVLNFYDKCISKYIVHKDSYSYYVDVIPSAKEFMNNKLLNCSRLKDFRFIDSEIKKKQFCYTDDEKVLANFDIFVYDKENVEFEQETNGRTVIKLTSGYSIYFLYPEGELSNPNDWEDNTIFILQGRHIIKNNLESIDAAEKFILENYKDKFNNKTTNFKNRKKRFVPKQLENVTRNGKDYRNNKDITGENMMQTFNFKGGEFGNWLNENDRQQSLNYGYDALLDLSKALSISPTDISLGGKLSIAFGSRGSGIALAHYEALREVINLTKMKGAGSLAHEWGHALDDIIGRQLGLSGFMTENYKYSDPSSEIIKDVIETMKYKMISGDEMTNKQIQEYEKYINRTKNIINSFFPEEHLTKEQLELKDKLIQDLIDNAEKNNEKFYDYISRGTGIKEIDELSDLRRQTIGRGISKDERINIAHLQNHMFHHKNQIGHPVRVKTDFYNNSIIFDGMYSKTEQGYWQSNIEMFARAFACYVSDKLGYKSDYLCGHADLALGFVTNKDNELELIKAFPEGEERKLINEKIEKLIEFMKKKTYYMIVKHKKSNQIMITIILNRRRGYMHRGTIFVIVNDNEVWKSTEFNGGMGLDCYGKEIVIVFQKVSTLQQFKAMVLAFDKTHHNYQDKVMLYKADEQKNPYVDNNGIKYFDYYKKDNQYSFFRDSQKSYIYTSDSNYIKNLSNQDVKIVCNNGIYILKPNQLLISDYGECINNSRESFGQKIDKDVPIDRLDTYKLNELDKSVTDNNEDVDYNY